MFSYLRQGQPGKIGELEITGNALVVQGQIFSVEDLKFSVEKIKDPVGIKILVRKKRFVKKGEPYIALEDTIEQGEPNGNQHNL